MKQPSPETLKIRQFVRSLSNDQLLSLGPIDLKDRMEKKLHINLEDNRNKVNNELARERGERKLRKGRGRKVAVHNQNSQEARQYVRLIQGFQELREFFPNGEEMRDACRLILAMLDNSDPADFRATLDAFVEENKNK